MVIGTDEVEFISLGPIILFPMWKMRNTEKFTTAQFLIQKYFKKPKSYSLLLSTACMLAIERHWFYDFIFKLLISFDTPLCHPMIIWHGNRHTSIQGNANT